MKNMKGNESMSPYKVRNPNELLSVEQNGFSVALGGAQVRA